MTFFRDIIASSMTIAIEVYPLSLFCTTAGCSSAAQITAIAANGRYKVYFLSISIRRMRDKQIAKVYNGGCDEA